MKVVTKWHKNKLKIEMKNEIKRKNNSLKLNLKIIKIITANILKLCICWILAQQVSVTSTIQPRFGYG